jgi:predicted phage-related endonuclease
MLRKRKNTLKKKTFELSNLSDLDIILAIFDKNTNKIETYCTNEEFGPREYEIMQKETKVKEFGVKSRNQ